MGHTSERRIPATNPMFTVNCPFLLMNSFVPSRGSTHQKSSTSFFLMRCYLVLLGHDRDARYFLRNASQIILLAVMSAFVSRLPSALKSAIFFQSASLVPL